MTDNASTPPPPIPPWELKSTGGAGGGGTNTPSPPAKTFSPPSTSNDQSTRKRESVVRSLSFSPAPSPSPSLSPSILSPSQFLKSPVGRGDQQDNGDNSSPPRPPVVVSGPGFNVAVVVGAGFRADLTLTARISVSADEAFAMLSDPEPAPWKHATVLRRRVISGGSSVGGISDVAVPPSSPTPSPSASRNAARTVEVEQSARWAFFRTVTTRLLVREDPRARTISYSLCRRGAMREFTGKWKVVSDGEGAAAPTTSSTTSSSSCVIELTQRCVPSFVPPPPFSGLLAHMMAKQASEMIRELQAECRRVSEEVRREKEKSNGGRSRVVERPRPPSQAPPAPLLSSLAQLLPPPPPFDRQRDGPTDVAASLLAALLGWAMSISASTPLAALWTLLAAAASVDASLHAVANVSRSSASSSSSSIPASTLRQQRQLQSPSSPPPAQRERPHPLLVRVGHETPAAARASLRSHPVARRPRRPKEDVGDDEEIRRRRSKSPSRSPAAAATKQNSNTKVNLARWHVPRRASAAAKEMRWRAKIDAVAALFVLVLSCSLALVVAFCAREGWRALLEVAVAVKTTTSAVVARGVRLVRPPPPPPPAKMIQLPQSLSRMIPEKVTLPSLENLPAFSVVEELLVEKSSAVAASARPAVEAASAAVASAASATTTAASSLRIKLKDASCSAVKPAVAYLEQSSKKLLESASSLATSLKSELEGCVVVFHLKRLASSSVMRAVELSSSASTSIASAASEAHAALRRVTGRQGPQAKLWFQS